MDSNASKEEIGIVRLDEMNHGPSHPLVDIATKVPLIFVVIFVVLMVYLQLRTAPVVDADATGGGVPESVPESAHLVVDVEKEGTLSVEGQCPMTE